MIILDRLPIRTVSTNQMRREHWRRRAERALKQRELIRFAWLEAGRPKIELPCMVVLTRIAFDKLDSDNLSGAMKAIRDEVAACIGVNDGDEGEEGAVSWIYRQENRVVKRGEFFVRIAIESSRDKAA